MPKTKQAWSRAALDVLSDGSNWRRLGQVITGAGITTAPEWWQWVMLVGLCICPLVAEFLDAVKRRQQQEN